MGSGIAKTDKDERRNGWRRTSEVAQKKEYVNEEEDIVRVQHNQLDLILLRIETRQMEHKYGKAKMGTTEHSRPSSSNNLKSPSQ